MKPQEQEPLREQWDPSFSTRLAQIVIETYGEQAKPAFKDLYEPSRQALKEGRTVVMVKSPAPNGITNMRAISLDVSIPRVLTLLNRTDDIKCIEH